jgi:hypothetical protein
MTYFYEIEKKHGLPLFSEILQTPEGRLWERQILNGLTVRSLERSEPSNGSDTVIMPLCVLSAVAMIIWLATSVGVTSL